MGLENLDLLKSTLLEIDAINFKLNQINRDDNITHKEINNAKETIKTSQEKIIEFEKEISECEEKIQTFSKQETDLATLKDSLIEIKQKRKSIIDKWKSHLDEIYGKVATLNSNELELGMMIPSLLFLCITLIGSGIAYKMGVITSADFEGAVSLGGTVCCLGIFAGLMGGGALGARRRDKVRLIIKQEFGETRHVVSRDLEEFNYSISQKYISYFISHIHEGPCWNTDDDPRYYSNQKRWIISESKMNAHWKSNQAHLTPESIFESKEESKLKSSISLFEELSTKLLSLQTKSREIPISINNCNVLIKQYESAITNNNIMIDSLNKQKNNLWKTIEHLIPYSDLINPPL